MALDTLRHLTRDNYLIAKIRGERSYILENQQINSLTEARSRTDFIGLLVEGQYGPALSKLDPNASSNTVEHALFSSYVTSLHELWRSATGDTKVFLHEYEMRIHAYDIAALISAKVVGMTWEEYVASRPMLSVKREQELHSLYSMEDLNVIAAEAGNRFLVGRLKGMSLSDVQPEKISLIKDIVVGWGEERFYKFVVTRLSGADRKNCLPLAGTLLDVTNIMIILRSKLIGSTEPRNHMVPSKWKLDHATIDQLIASPEAGQALELLGSHYYYHHIFAGSRQKFEDTKSLSFLELALREYLIHLSKRVFLGFPYSVGIVFAFLLLKENEARNLSAILTGVEAGLAPETIRSNLALEH